MNTCPTQERLEMWLAERLSEADRLAIETHVEHCTNICQPLLDSLSGFEGDLPDAGATVATRANLPALPDLPGYEILSPLGSGGMGVVYKARHRYMSRIVAIKMLPSSVTKDAAAVARFNREVKAAAALRHPNIVATDNADQAGGVHFLVMEYVDGADLSALVKRNGPLPVSRSVDYVLQAARGLDYAHRHGVVHRDVKPANLLLDTEGTVRVLDMGVARLDSTGDAELTELTGQGQIMGTVDYMAPEQALDTRGADARADIYSLGITLWYLLTGRPVYVGDSPLAKLLAHREQPLPALRAACPAAGAELEGVFEKMAAKKPEDRYQSMAEVIAALEPCRAQHDAANQDVTSALDLSLQGGGAAVATKAAAQQVAGAVGVGATVAMRTAEVGTDPHTERSLTLPAEALPRPPRQSRRKFAVATGLVGLLAVAAAAAYVVRVQTDNGEVVIESEVGGISVDVERDGETVKDDWQLRKGADNRWVVRSGLVNVKLPAELQGEFTLEQDTARLVRDGKILVKITRKAKADAPAVAVEDRDRAAAEWVLEQGGKVGVYHLSGWSEVAHFSDLPAGTLKVSSVLLSGTKAVNNEDLNRFTGLKQLSQLNLWSTGIGATGISEIAKMPSLESLWIADTQVPTSALARLTHLPRLHWLALSAKQSDDGWASLETLPLLRELTVVDASPDDVQRLAEVNQLRTIWITFELAQEVRAELLKLNPLCRVIVGNIRGKAVGNDPVREFVTRLRGRGAEIGLRLFQPDISPQIEESFREGWPVCVNYIFLPRNCQLSVDDYPFLSCLNSVNEFRARSAIHADRLAAALGEQKLMAYTVDLSGSDLTDEGLDKLASLPLLRSLDVQRTHVTDKGVKSLQKALPNCKVLWAPAAPAAPNDDPPP